VKREEIAVPIEYVFPLPHARTGKSIQPNL
jgi:hypothetical protein